MNKNVQVYTLTFFKYFYCYKVNIKKAYADKHCTIQCIYTVTFKYY